MVYPPENESCVITKEFVFDKAEFGSCHASTIVQTDEGDLLTAFFGGSWEGNPDCCIWISRKKEGEKWESPKKIASGKVNGNDAPCWNPVLFQVPGGKLFLFYKVGYTIADWKGYMLVSEDGGYTWDMPAVLPDGFLGPIKNKPVITGNKILYGSSSEPGRWLVHFEKSDFDGNNWTRSKDINADNPGIDIIQPTLLCHKEGTIQAICRTKSTIKNLYTTFSKDNGDTWSSPKNISILSNNSGLDAVTLSDGRFLMAFNRIPTNWRWHEKAAPRTPLNIHISSDGIKWDPFVLLETEKGEYSYPAVIQTSDGLIHIVYTYRREKIRHVVLDLSRIK